MHLTVEQVTDLLDLFGWKGRVTSHSSCGKMIVLECQNPGYYSVLWCDKEARRFFVDSANFADLSETVEFYNAQCKKLF